MRWNDKQFATNDSSKWSVSYQNLTHWDGKNFLQRYFSQCEACHKAYSVVGIQCVRVRVSYGPRKYSNKKGKKNEMNERSSKKSERERGREMWQQMSSEAVLLCILFFPFFDGHLDRLGMLCLIFMPTYLQRTRIQTRTRQRQPDSQHFIWASRSTFEGKKRWIKKLVPTFCYNVVQAIPSPPIVSDLWGALSKVPTGLPCVLNWLLFSAELNEHGPWRSVNWSSSRYFDVTIFF